MGEPKAKEQPVPILEIARITGQSEEELARHWARLFIQHDRLMLKTFERWAGPERALRMHDRVWDNPQQPLSEIFLNMGPTAQDALAAYARAFMIHDYFSLQVLREEIGDVDAIEAHHSLWEGQAEDYAITPEHRDKPTGPLSWQDLYEMYNAHASREGLPYDLVEVSDDRLIIESTHCAYFDTLVAELGREAAEDHLHLIAIESTDRTIEGFLHGIGREDEIRGVMTRHRCHGDEVCRIEFTRRDPDEAQQVGEPVERIGTICFFGPKETPQRPQKSKGEN